MVQQSDEKNIGQLRWRCLARYGNILVVSGQEANQQLYMFRLHIMERSKRGGTCSIELARQHCAWQTHFCQEKCLKNDDRTVLQFKDWNEWNNYAESRHGRWILDFGPESRHVICYDHVPSPHLSSSATLSPCPNPLNPHRRLRSSGIVTSLGSEGAWMLPWQIRG